MFGEPAPTQYDLNFVLLGIPVRVDPWFWLVALMLGFNSKDPLSLAIWIVALFIAILIHELGHGLVMRAYGFRPWIILYGMGGLTCRDQGYAYRSKGNDTLGQILISFAGPAAGFLLAAVLVVALMLAGYREQLLFLDPLGVTPVVLMQNMRVADLLNNIFFISVAWGLVNLLPIYPLDGGQIAREVFLKVSPSEGIRLSLMLSIIAGAAMAMYGFVYWKSIYVAILFGYLAYSSFTTLQNYRGRNPW